MTNALPSIELHNPNNYKICKRIFSKYNYINFIDLETTGFDENKDHIIEIGILKINMQTFQAHSSFHTKVFIPDTVKINKEIVELTGITEDQLKDAPKVENLLDDILIFLGEGEPVIAHNSQFDMKFLNKAFSLKYKDFDIYEKYEIFDTLSISRNYYDKNSLDYLASIFLIKKDTYHGALKDCYKLWHVLIMLNNVERAVNNIFFSRRCPECGGFLVERTNRWNKTTFLGCNNYPSCMYPRKNKGK